MLSYVFIWNTRFIIHLISLQLYEVILVPRIYICRKGNEHLFWFQNSALIWHTCEHGQSSARAFLGRE